MKRTLCIFAILILLPACNGQQDEDTASTNEVNGKELATALFEAAGDGNLEKVKESLNCMVSARLQNC